MSQQVLIIFITLFMFPIFFKGQTYLEIDDMSNPNEFFTQFNSGSGSVNLTLNTLDFETGSGSTQINYNFNSSANSNFILLKNYGTATKDYSWMPNEFQIKVKGNNVGTLIKIRLWEDLQQNGSINSEDEVYESEAKTLGNDWQTLSFPINTFTKVTGSGNDELDLNRIRAWDITIISSDNNESGEILIDQVSLITNYSIPQENNIDLAGSFVQLWNTTGCNCGQWSEARWEEEFEKMQEVCLDKFIIQYGVYDDLSWYSPSALNFVGFQENALNKIMNAAENTGMKIWLGLYFDEEWNSSDKSLNQTYDQLKTKHQQTASEIYNLFGNYSAFSGWYIPQEINDLEWQTNPEKDLLFNWLKDVSDELKSIDNDLPIMIAPFFNLWQPADVIGEWYNELLQTATNITHVYPQDGVGITLKQVDYHVPLYFNAIKQACDNNNTTFGATIESFKQLTGWPIDGGSFSATSTSIISLENQIKVAHDFASSENIIQFSWSYMQPNNTSQSSELFQDYKMNLNCIPTTSNRITKDYKISFWPNPSSDYINFSDLVSDLIIYSTDGKLIRSYQNVQGLNIGYLKTGTYILNLNGSEFQKLVIGHH